MSVYLEDAIFNTLSIDFCLLVLTQFSLRQKISILKTFFSSFVGCSCSLFLTFFNLPNISLIFIKIVLGLIMCALIINKFGLKPLFLYFLVFLSFTFIFFGFCYFVLFLFGIQITTINALKQMPITLGLLSIALLFYVFFLTKIIMIFYKKQKLNNFNYSIIVKIFDKQFKLKGYLDTGNLLQDNESGLPVIIVPFNVFNKFFDKKLSIVDFLNCNLQHKIKGKYIDYSSVSQKSKMFVVTPQSVFLKEDKYKKINVLLGVTIAYNWQSGIEALLSPLAV